jgi:UDP-glucose 4-epimerase
MSTWNRVIVTGGAGFIGTELIKKLRVSHPETDIISIDNYFSGSRDVSNQVSGVTYIEDSTHNIEQYVASYKPEVIFHFGEYSRIVASFGDIEHCHNFNTRGTFDVINACRKHNVKLVYAASSSKFGNGGADEHLSPYAWMKAKNIELIQNMANWYGGFDYAITYFFNVYGPGQITTGKMAAVIGIFQQCVLDNRPIPVVSPGTQRRDFTHVDDIVEGVILAAEKGSGDGYLLGTGVNHSLLEVAQMFKHPYEFIPERKGERFTSQAYASKAQEELGWHAKRSLPEYVDQWLASVGE